MSPFDEEQLFLAGNGVYMAQSIWYSRTCNSYHGSVLLSITNLFY